MSDQDRTKQDAGAAGSGAGGDGSSGGNPAPAQTPGDAEDGFSDNSFTGTEATPVVREMARTGAGATEDPGVLSNFVQRTDNEFNDVEDRSLIGDDLADDDEEDADR